MQWTFSSVSSETEIFIFCPVYDGGYVAMSDTRMNLGSSDANCGSREAQSATDFYQSHQKTHPHHRHLLE